MKLDLFDAKPYPADLSPVPKAWLGDQWEADATCRFFQGKSIHDVTLRAILEDYPHSHSTFHHHLTDHAFSFFLPALMKVVLDHYDDAPGNICSLGESLVNTLFRMAKGEMDERLTCILNQYTRPQLGVIAEFLKAMSDRYYYPLEEDDDAANALKLFWGQYLPAE